MLLPGSPLAARRYIRGAAREGTRPKPLGLCSQATLNDTKARWTSVNRSRFQRWAVRPVQKKQDHLPDFVPHALGLISGSPTSLDRAIEHKACLDRVRLGALALQRFVQRRGEKGDPHGCPSTGRNSVKL